ncbi:hypothetical protein [Streptantibioticus silvisoli]|uniref:DUF4253 domain-containing protein n=1 Tax=Streptantibioticus silvisoli TaxID=2705255 RepID=A0ABT6VWA5_9ACTN|nr:hypothetical protein [Streptantibioticus silvisoli]MDI5962772.1 hypothetical protein [Streptantibioticus silvisoli]
MSYDVLVTGHHVPERLGGFLAALFDVSADRVFVGDMSEVDSWDKAAVDRSLVSCTYEPRSAELAWYLSIYADPADLPQQPSQAELSRRMSAELDTVTLFPEGTRTPEVFHFVTSGGTQGLVRFAEDEPGICEVSTPVPEFPAAAVAHFEDEVRYIPFPSPVTLRYFPADPGGGSFGDVRDRLTVWERLTVRMARNWPPLGWYGPSLYAADLECRDDITALLPELAEPERDNARTVLAVLDDAYRELTVQDGGAALVASGVIGADLVRGMPWYWQRGPLVLPWDPAEPAPAGA